MWFVIMGKAPLLCLQLDSKAAIMLLLNRDESANQWIYLPLVIFYSVQVYRQYRFNADDLCLNFNGLSLRLEVYSLLVRNRRTGRHMSLFYDQRAHCKSVKSIALVV